MSDEYVLATMIQLKELKEKDGKLYDDYIVTLWKHLSRNLFALNKLGLLPKEANLARLALEPYFRYKGDWNKAIEEFLSFVTKETDKQTANKLNEAATKIAMATIQNPLI